MTETKLQLIIEALNKTDPAFNALKGHLRDGQSETDKLNAKSQDLSASIGRLALSLVSVGTAIAAIKAGISYLARIETASLGIASAFMTGGKYIDATSGKALAAQDALNAAQGDSKQIIEELQYANLQTIATLDELINAYQVTLPVALAKGFDRQQVKDFTVAMVQAAGAIGLQMNMLGEETRSLLTGTIDPRTSRIATVLGLRNEDINKFKGDAAGLFNFLMDKLAAYRVAGIASQETWAGLLSNSKDIVLQSLGKAIEPLFDALKYELKAVTDSIVTIDDKAKKITWNPEFLEGVTAFRDGIQSIIAEVYRLGMLLDKVGGSYTRLMHGVTFSSVTGDDSWLKKNDEYRERYMKSEKALQNMAMRSQGWKPVTSDIDKQMREAVAQGKKKFEQTQINVGGEDEGTQQLLRYYREISPKQKPGWNANPRKPEEDKKAEKLREEWEKISRDIEKDQAGLGLDEYDKKLIAIDKKAEDWKAEKAVKKTPGAGAEVDTWAAAMKEEAAFDRRGKGFDALETLDKQLTESPASELEKRLIKVREAADKELDLLNTGFKADLMTVDDYMAKRSEIEDTAAKERTKIETESGKAIREAEINARLAALDLDEKEGTFHRETIEERIRLMEELQVIQESYLDTLDKQADTTAWYTQLSAINATKAKMVELRTELTPVQASLRQFADQATDVWKNVGNAVTRTFDKMTDSLTDFVMTGKFNFEDFANSVIRDMVRIMIQAQGTGPLASAAGAGLEGFFGDLFGPSTSLDTPQIEGEVTPIAFDSGLGYHSGGMGNEPSFFRIVPNLDVLPRYHKGLGPGERLSITTDDEMTLTPGQQKAMWQLAQASGGAVAPQQITNEAHVHLTINALDSRSVSQALAQHQGQIVGIINQAYNKIGKRGPLGS